MKQGSRGKKFWFLAGMLSGVVMICLVIVLTCRSGLEMSADNQAACVRLSNGGRIFFDYGGTPPGNQQSRKGLHLYHVKLDGTWWKADIEYDDEEVEDYLVFALSKDEASVWLINGRSSPPRGWDLETGSVKAWDLEQHAPYGEGVAIPKIPPGW